MVSSARCVLWIVLLRAAADGIVSRGLSPMQGVLAAIDYALTCVALGLIVGIGVRWLTPPRRNPLQDAPPRPSRLHENAIAATVLVYLLAAAGIQGLLQWTTGGADGVPATLLVGNLAHIVGIAMCLVVASRTFDGGIRAYWTGQGGERRQPWLAATTVLTLVTIGLCPLIRDITVGVILHFAPEHTFDVHPTIQALHDPNLPVGIHAALWVGALAVAPVAEEMFFRGLVQTWLVNLLPRRWPAIALASLAFGAVHFGQPHAVPALVVLGALIGYAYERTGSLLPPVLIHAAFNLKTLTWDALAGVLW